jgi:uracil-DNA glycosylase
MSRALSQPNGSPEFPPGWPVDSDWTEPLRAIFQSTEFQTLQKFVADERSRQTVFPSSDAVFNAFRFTPLADTKVVILGQDPYHGPDQAHGLSFSVVGDCKLPPSLKNIYKELAGDLQVPLPTSGNLGHWAKQGVLLLNTVLTVRSGVANSHAKRGWETFTDAVIRLVGQQRQNKIVFLLWGKSAEKKTNLISSQHAIITSAHPSPLSAHRGFFRSRPFSRANQALVESGRTPISWSDSQTENRSTIFLA